MRSIVDHCIFYEDMFRLLTLNSVLGWKLFPLESLALSSAY